MCEEFCISRNKERYVYCNICMKKMLIYDVYCYVHIMNKTYNICSIECYNIFFIN